MHLVFVCFFSFSSSLNPSLPLYWDNITPPCFLKATSSSSPLVSTKFWNPDAITGCTINIWPLSSRQITERKPTGKICSHCMSVCARVMHCSKAWVCSLGTPAEKAPMATKCGDWCLSLLYKTGRKTKVGNQLDAWPSSFWGNLLKREFLPPPLFKPKNDINTWT